MIFHNFVSTIYWLQKPFLSYTTLINLIVLFAFLDFVKMSDPRITDSSPAAQFLAREFPVQSPLISKLRAFIPELSAANEQLQRAPQTSNTGISIEHMAMN